MYRAQGIWFGPPQCQKDAEKSKVSVPDLEMVMVNRNENYEGNQKLSMHMLDNGILQTA